MDSPGYFRTILTFSTQDTTQFLSGAVTSIHNGQSQLLSHVFRANPSPHFIRGYKPKLTMAVPVTSAHCEHSPRPAGRPKHLFLSTISAILQLILLE